MKNRPDLAALAFCGLVVVAVAVLAALRVPIPDFLPMVGLVVAGVGGGAALNGAVGSRPAPEDFLPEIAPRGAETGSLPVPAPRHYDPAETSSFPRFATHD